MLVIVIVGSRVFCNSLHKYFRSFLVSCQFLYNLSNAVLMCANIGRVVFKWSYFTVGSSVVIIFECGFNNFLIVQHAIWCLLGEPKIFFHNLKDWIKIRWLRCHANLYSSVICVLMNTDFALPVKTFLKNCFLMFEYLL